MPGSNARHAPAKKRVDTERRERGVVVQVGDARKRSAERSELEWKNAIANDGDARSRVVSNSGGARRDHHGIARGQARGQQQPRATLGDDGARRACTAGVLREFERLAGAVAGRRSITSRRALAGG